MMQKPLCLTLLGKLLAIAAVGIIQPLAAAAEPAKIHTFKGSITVQAEDTALNTTRAEVAEGKSLKGMKGVVLKEGLGVNVGTPSAEPDLVFGVQPADTGRYVIRTHAATNATGTETMRKATSKHESLRLMIAVGDSRPTKRVVFTPWSKPDSCRQTLGKFTLNAKGQDIRVWLPKGVILDYIQFSSYAPPKVPDAVLTYQPTVVPPPSRPRIWVNAESLPKIRENLTKEENAPLWKQVRDRAGKPFEFEVEPGAEISYNPGLEKAVTAKAFVYLMTGEKRFGNEAVSLTREYLAAVEFGNLLDITREIGRAIYAASQVYDWCYDLMSPADREGIRENLMRLADDMEIGWPPFRQMIVNGHGNEAQVNRDLLCLAIAIYDEDPVPYQYCSYRILEELVPMRRFEYQSPRHNQGVAYGPYRFGWDMHAAWLFRRMTGKPVFDENIADVCKFWHYMRVPTGETLRDGDGFSDGRPATLGATSLLCYAYGNDPVIKWDFERQGGLPSDPILVLLLNDPDLKAADGLHSLPLTLDFGPVLGSMVARTGWNMGRNLSDVVVEMKGGGYNFGNHQHSDAGSFQIYYHGLQAVDLGQYRFYGTPYDSNFCKRSVSHSMMLVVDPDEKFHSNVANDGGTRFVRSCPRTPGQTMEDPLFANGRVLTADFGPSPTRPFYSLFSVDLTSAYSKKIKRFVRTFCFLNLDSEETPAALIIADNVVAAKPEFRKYWQVNTLNPPEATEDGVILRNSALGMAGTVDVRMFRPEPGKRTVEILSGGDANTVFGHAFTPPKPERPEANGHRVMFSPSEPRSEDEFLTVMLMSDGQAEKPPIAVTEQSDAFVVTIGDRTVVISRSGDAIEKAIEVGIRGTGKNQMILAGLAPGAWSVEGEEGNLRLNVDILPKKNTAFLALSAGSYTIAPGDIAYAPKYAEETDLAPRKTRSYGTSGKDKN